MAMVSMHAVQQNYPPYWGRSSIDDAAIESSFSGELVVTFDRATGEMKVEEAPMQPLLPI